MGSLQWGQIVADALEIGRNHRPIVGAGTKSRGPDHLRQRLAMTVAPIQALDKGTRIANRQNPAVLFAGAQTRSAAIGGCKNRKPAAASLVKAEPKTVFDCGKDEQIALFVELRELRLRQRTERFDSRSERLQERLTLRQHRSRDHKTKVRCWNAPDDLGEIPEALPERHCPGVQNRERPAITDALAACLESRFGGPKRGDIDSQRQYRQTIARHAFVQE